MPSCSLLKPHENDTEGKLARTKRRGDRSIPSQMGELAQRWNREATSNQAAAEREGWGHTNA